MSFKPAKDRTKQTNYLLEEWGKEKVGKSAFALTAPTPIYYFNFDRGYDRVEQNMLARSDSEALAGLTPSFRERYEQDLIHVADYSSRFGDDAELLKLMDTKAGNQLLQDFDKDWQAMIKSPPGGTAVIDSVSAETPVIIKDEHGLFECLSMEELWERASAYIAVLPETGEQARQLQDVSVQVPRSKGRWTAAHGIIRHHYKGTILKITTAGGVIRVTPNHSLFVGNGKEKLASDLKIGDTLTMPLFAEPAPVRDENMCWPFAGTLDMAWTHGLFTAEGWAGSAKSNGWSWTISNQDLSLLERAASAVEANYHVGTKIHAPGKDGCYKLEVSKKLFAEKMRADFYDNRGQKRIPVQIMNAPKTVRDAFFDGYMAGDGSADGKTFTTKSHTLAAGLIWWLRGADKQVTVHTREDKPDVVAVQMPQVGDSKLSRRAIKSIVEEAYDGFVYDIETDSGQFACGVGNIVAHNTGTIIWNIATEVLQKKVPANQSWNAYQYRNSFFRRLLESARSSGKHVIFIHHDTDIYAAEGQVTGQKAQGDKLVARAADIVIRLTTRKQEGQGKPDFVVRVEECGLNPEMTGLEMIDVIWDDLFDAVVG